MPLAKATDDQTAIRGSRVKPRQQLATPALEPGLEIPRAARDLSRVRKEILVLQGHRLKLRLSGGFSGVHRDGKQRGADSSAERNARAATADQR
jgi:hypothetical protein